MSNLENMTFSDLLNLECDKQEVTKKTLKSKMYCYDCECDLLLYDAAFHVCPECGLVDDTPVYDIQRESEYYQKPILYKRRIYCQDKLKLLTCKKTSRSLKYEAVKNELQAIDDEFNNIDELFFTMKRCSLSKFYHHIYNLWYDIKKTKLIDMTMQQIDHLSRQFVELESKFKANQGVSSRKNMFNYNSTIYYLMKKNKLKGHWHVLLPYNHSEMYKKIRSIDR
jgi:hypothetical protein